MHPIVRFDILLLTGAAVQLALVLFARRFRPQDWLLPLFLLIGGSVGFFLFLRICSPDISEIADGAIVGFLMSLGAAAVYVAEYAPPRLNPTALLSLTITFWAAYFLGNLSHAWLVPALVMTVLTLLFAAGVGSSLSPARMLFQAWSLTLAALLSADGVPARIAAYLNDWRKDELAPTLHTADILIAGAQFFLLAQMAIGLFLLIDPATRDAWAPDGRDERPRFLGVVALLVQGTAFVWLRRSGGEYSTDLLALATFAALAHGAMSGADASNAEPPEVPIDPELTLTPVDWGPLQDVLLDLRDFFVRRRAALGVIAAALVALVLFARR